MADDNSIRNGPGRGRAVGQNRDRDDGPSRSNGPRNNRSSSSVSNLSRDIRARALDGANSMMDLRESLDSNGEMLRAWEQARGPEGTPPGQAKKLEQQANGQPPGQAKKDEAQARPPETPRARENEGPGEGRKNEGPRPADDDDGPGRSGEARKNEVPGREPPGQAKKSEGPSRPETPRQPERSEARRPEGEPPGQARKNEGPSRPEQPKPPEPPKPPETSRRPEGEHRKAESLMDRMREALEARKAEQRPPEARRRTEQQPPQPAPRPAPETPQRAPHRPSAPPQAAQPQPPPRLQPENPRAGEMRLPVLPQVRKPDAPLPRPPAPVEPPATQPAPVQAKRPEPTHTRPLVASTPVTVTAPAAAPVAVVRTPEKPQVAETPPARPLEVARAARAEVPAAPAPAPTVRNERAQESTRPSEAPATHTTVVSRGSADGAQNRAGRDSEAQSRSVVREVRENRLLTRFLPGRASLEEELENLQTGPRVEAIGKRQQGKGGGGGQQSGGQSSGQGSGAQAAQAENPLEAPIDPRTGLPRSLIRPALLPIVPQLEQLFGHAGLAYTPETEETPQVMRSFWIAMAWLSHHEQTGLSERMVYFGAAMFDGMQGWRRKLQGNAEESTVNRLLAMLAAEGGFLGEHSLRVMTLADAVCDDMKLADPELREQVRSGALLRDLGMAGLNYEQLPPQLAAQAQELRQSGDLHMAGRLADIGALFVPAEIRHKPGPLDAGERAIMEKHPEFGEEFLGRFPAFRHLGPIVRAHHERWDGRGYPDGLMGRRIPMAARIIAVADVWDALTSDRPWRSAWDYDSAYRYVRDKAGTQFDPEVARAFLNSVHRLRANGYLE